MPVVVNAWEKKELMVYFQNHSHSQVLTRTRPYLKLLAQDLSLFPNSQ